MIIILKKKMLKHIPSVDIPVAHSRSVFKGLYVIIQNQFPYEES